MKSVFRRRVLFPIFCFTHIFPAVTAGQIVLETFETNDPRVKVDLIFEGIPLPTTLEFAPDGRLFFLERETGNVRMVDKDWNLLEDPVMTVPIDYHRLEAGAMSLAIAPVSQSTETLIYVSHVTAEDTWSISRFTEDGSGNGSDLERVIDFSDCLVGEEEETRWHNINSLHFAPNVVSATPESLLYVSFGDGGGIKLNGEIGLDDTAQDPSTWCGGLYWIDPEDPPSPSEASAHRVCIGLRNSYDFCFQPETDTIFLTENGYNSHDEINAVRVGANCGWPVTVGARNDPRFVDPILDMVWVTAPTGISFYAGGRLPSEYKNKLFFCEWGQGEVRVLDIERDEEAEVSVTRDFYLIGKPDIFSFKPIKNWGFIDLTEGPDGAFYLSAGPGAGPGVKGGILRIDRTESSKEPFVGIRVH